MKVARKWGIPALLGASLLSAALLLPIGCGASEDPQTLPQPTLTATSRPAGTQPAASTAPGPTIVPMEETVAPTPTPPQGTRPSGADHYQGITFVVSEGSEPTFTVEEQLVRLPLPNDAVMRTTALSGEVQLGGRPSVIEIDLQQLSSDQEFRDRYVRTRMFGDHPSGIFTVPNLDSLVTRPV